MIRRRDGILVIADTSIPTLKRELVGSDGRNVKGGFK